MILVGGDSDSDADASASAGAGAIGFRAFCAVCGVRCRRSFLFFSFREAATLSLLLSFPSFFPFLPILFSALAPHCQIQMSDPGRLMLLLPILCPMYFTRPIAASPVVLLPHPVLPRSLLPVYLFTSHLTLQSSSQRRPCNIHISRSV